MSEIVTKQKYVVSNEYEFVYFVIQKVACSSVKTALLPLFDLDTKRYERVNNDGTAGLNIHRMFDNSRYQIRREQFVQGLDDRYASYFKFAFVRNPWDRLVSCYTQKLSPQGVGLPRYEYGGGIKLHKGMSFSEFVEAVHQIPDEEANVHFRSQHETICNMRGEIMADFVGRFENLGEDFAFVAKTIGAPEIQLPHLLRSKGRGGSSYVDFYDYRLRDLVYERYHGDIETFGYSFSAGSSPSAIDLRPSVARSTPERPSTEEDRSSRFENRIRSLERNLEKQRSKSATLRKENRRLNRRLKNAEGRLEAISSSKTWRFVTMLGRFKASFRSNTSSKG